MTAQSLIARDAADPLRVRRLTRLLLRLGCVLAAGESPRSAAKLLRGTPPLLQLAPVPNDGRPLREYLPRRAHVFLSRNLMWVRCSAAGLAATVALVYLVLPRLFTKDAAVAAGVRPLTLQARPSGSACPSSVHIASHAAASR